MARMIPSRPHPDCRSDGELELFRRFAEEPGTDAWFVLHSLTISRHRHQQSGEADFVVVVPGLGVLVIEVKACRSLHIIDGVWYYGSDERGDRRGPFRQAAEAMWSLRDHVLEKGAVDLRITPLMHAVFFTHCECTVTSPEWLDWQLVDRRTYRARLAGDHVRTILQQGRRHLARTTSTIDLREGYPTAEQCDALVNLFRPRFEFFESPRARTRRIEEEAKRYTEAQFRVLDYIDEHPRATISGPAGTGKTLLALEAASRAAGRQDPAGRAPEVLLTCFNGALSAWLREQAPPAVTTCTLSRYMLDLCGIETVPQEADRSFWESDLPMRTLERLLDMKGAPRFDELVVDEAQDLLAPAFLDVLDASLRGGLQGGRWRAFGDFEKQAIQGRHRQHVSSGLERLRVSSGPPLNLRENCRNLPRVAHLVQSLGGLQPGYRSILRPDDGRMWDLHFYRNEREQMDLLVGTLEACLASGEVQDIDIVLLSSRVDECAAAARLPARWNQRLQALGRRKGGGIRRSTIHAFKGLEARAVILTDIEHVKTPEAQALLYVGLTRTLERLTVLAHERVRQEIAAIIS